MKYLRRNVARDSRPGDRGTSGPACRASLGAADTIAAPSGMDLQNGLRPWRRTTPRGSGITASVLSLALERIGHRNHAVYDGSWAEWGMYDDLPVAKGQ